MPTRPHLPLFPEVPSAPSCLHASLFHSRPPLLLSAALLPASCPATRSQPLWSALKEELSGSTDFLNAALTWLRSQEDPSRGAEAYTEVDVSSHGGDLAKIVKMLDYLLVEVDSLLGFVARLDVESIREACVGSGTEHTAFIRAFATRSKRSLARVNLGYHSAYGETLPALITRELLSEGSRRTNEWYAYLAKFIVVPDAQADMLILEQAMGGASVDHAALFEFLCGRHPSRVRAAKAKYEAAHDDSLVDKLSDSISGDTKKLALRLLKGKRDLSQRVDETLAAKQAHGLHDGTAQLIPILVDNNTAQNKAVARIYEDAYDTSLRRLISKQYSGPIKSALTALLSGPSEWYAAQLKAALSAEKVDDKAVCRIVGAHDKDEVKQIATAYQKKYGVSLKEAITNQCKGNYKRLCVAWIDLPDQLAQPDKKIDVPTKEDVPDEGGGQGAAGAGQARGSEAGGGGGGGGGGDYASDEDDVVPSDFGPSSPLFQAKLKLWTKKYKKYKKAKLRHKAQHYQQLLLFYPPVEKGDALLLGYYSALEEEYTKKGGTGEGGGTEDWTQIWFDAIGDAELEAAGVSRSGLKSWLDVTEPMIAKKEVALKELKGHWGLNDEPPPPPKTIDQVVDEDPQPVPLAPLSRLPRPD